MEIYNCERFLAITGHPLTVTPDDIRPYTTDQLAALISVEPRAAPVQLAPSSGAQRSSAEHDDLWEHIFAHDRFLEQHRRRFLGDTSLDGGDHSLTVIRLLNTLARWTLGDAAKMRATISLLPTTNGGASVVLQTGWSTKLQRRSSTTPHTVSEDTGC